MLGYVLLSLLVFEHGFIHIRFGIFAMNTQWMLDTKVKVFLESNSCFMKWPWNCISWNDLKEKFHSVSFPLKLVLF